LSPSRKPSFRDTKISQHETVDGDHGRIETRTYTVIHDVAWLQERHDWPGLQGVVMVESKREIGDKIEQETRLYITSLVWLACQLGPVIRHHWAMENSLHWVMDERLIVGEDNGTVYYSGSHYQQEFLNLETGETLPGEAMIEP
jgi:hypothetical protein